MSKFVSVSSLQQFSWHCLNADEKGRPKSGTFGATRRDRISSQAKKRPRRMLLQEMNPDLIGAGRTRLLLPPLALALARKGRDPEEAHDVARAALAAIGLGFNKKKPEATEYLVFVGTDEIDGLADVMHEADHWTALQQAVVAGGDDKADNKAAGRAAAGPKVRDALLEVLGGSSRSASLALFGRMMADNDELNVAAGVQVAHSLGVTETQTQTDNWTAVDDYSPTGGAGMLERAFFTSSVMYDYTTVNVTRLVGNLGGDELLARQVLDAYLWATVLAIPTGRQNSFAAQNPPSLMLFSTGQRCPWNLSNAFDPAVRFDPREPEGGLVGGCIKALDEFLVWTKETFDSDSTMYVAGKDLPKLGLKAEHVRTVIDRVGAEALPIR